MFGSLNANPWKISTGNSLTEAHTNINPNSTSGKQKKNTFIGLNTKETHPDEERFKSFKEIIVPLLKKDRPENAPFDEIVEDLYRYIPPYFKGPEKVPLISTPFGEVTPAMFAQLQQFVNNNKHNV